MKRIKVSESTASRLRVFFTCVDAAATQTRLQSSDMSTFVVYLSKNGGTPAVPNTSTDVTQVNATNTKGLFYIQLRAADVDTVGTLLIDIKNTGGTKSMEPREREIEVTTHDPLSLFEGTILEGIHSVADGIRGAVRMLIAPRSGYVSGATVVRDLADTKDSIELTTNVIGENADGFDFTNPPDLT